MSGAVIGASEALSDGGVGLCFTSAQGRPAFAIRFGGTVHAWINCCPHRGTPLDYEPGAFFDEEGRHLACASHGALFLPDSGQCVAGPCRGARLVRVAVEEREGLLYLSDHADAPQQDLA